MGELHSLLYTKFYHNVQLQAIEVSDNKLHSQSSTPDSLFNYRGQLIVPSGINVLDGGEIEREQEDYHLIMERIELAVNVNVAEDLRLCERILQGDFI